MTSPASETDRPLDHAPQPLNGEQLRSSLAENLRLARAERRWSLRELAARSEVSKALLSRIERGEGNPSIETLFRIAAALALPVSDLIAVQEPAQVKVVRAGEGQSARSERGKALSRLIFAASGHGHIEIYEFTMQPNTATEWDARPGHGVTEYAVVESGRALVGYVGEEVLLGPGDAISWRHGPRNTYRSLEEGAHLVCVVAYDA